MLARGTALCTPARRCSATGTYAALRRRIIERPHPRCSSSQPRDAEPRRKTLCIGILGGMSPSSTELYYVKLNNSVREMLGGLHSSNCIIRSVDFEEIASLQSAGRWDDAAAADLEAGGAELLILVSPQPHENRLPAALSSLCFMAETATCRCLRVHMLP
jgi:hypothetical protein